MEEVPVIKHTIEVVGAHPTSVVLKPERSQTQYIENNNSISLSGTVLFVLNT